MLVRACNKLLLLGLDCADPHLVFDRWLDDLPNIKRLVEAGVYGPLLSCTPPITVPAWISMVTGRDPGELGIYGFRNRSDTGYDDLKIVTSADVGEKTVWDYLGEAGKESVVIGVPPSYPVKPVRGDLISWFLTPGTGSEYTYPHELRHEVEELVGEYLFDVADYRTEEKGRLLERIREMTVRRFRVARHLLRIRPWDFFMMVEIGTDRMHHGFWQFMDPQHVLYPGENPFQDAVRQYYILVDGLIGELLEVVDAGTRVMIVSDHGAKRMDGRVALNEWLIRQGYLVLKRYPDRPTPFGELEVDWSRTRAWGAGGYYGRLFVNLKGREPQGTVDPSEYEGFRRQLREELEALGDEEGRPIGTRVVIPQEVYREVRNLPPDMEVDFGDLRWRSSGAVGGGQIHLRGGEDGIEGANYDWHGIFIMADRKDLAGPARKGEPLEGLQLMDVAPTILESLGVPRPSSVHGRVVRPRRAVSRRRRRHGSSTCGMHGVRGKERVSWGRTASGSVVAVCRGRRTRCTGGKERCSLGLLDSMNGSRKFEAFPRTKDDASCASLRWTKESWTRRSFRKASNAF
ncbi:alkaline phosphatase family protein [Limnochorda pilosa]|uniref:Phosphodiesterase n=1 Tax=Limnochorda pilosa TaxID=1555112 RepID=A0A0K2SMR2_LIMPI|nr:alkaline phosphatase family protein [Limnochorda pilosa]BAS28109.1 phosphodiesterase [Limnochorda pilosa]